MDIGDPAFTEARNNMVDSQVRPNKVADPRILAAMRRLPRERFAPAGLASLVYADADVPLGRGRVLLAPMVIARLVQLTAVAEGERALVVAAGPGYGSALLASCGARVTALEDDPALLAQARLELAELAPGVSLISGPLAAGWPAGAPYDVILIEGAVVDIPRAVGEQLRRDGGKLVTICYRWRRRRPGGAGRGHQCRPAQAADVRLRLVADPRSGTGGGLRVLIDVWWAAVAHRRRIGRGAGMVLRRSLRIGLGIALVAGPAFAQAPNPQAPNPQAPKSKFATTKAPSQPPAKTVQAKPLTVAQAAPAPVKLAQPTAAANPTPAQPDIGVPHTLAEALAATYSNQPALQAERAKLRATDENVPAALAGWRPTVILSGNGGYGDGKTVISSSSSGGALLKNRSQRDIGIAQATLTQPIYTGGKTQANVNRAKNQVMAERATLINQEQTSFTNAVNAYVGVIQAQQLLALNINNEQVLTKQLQATNDRFRVGEITKTDVAQAEAALAGATAQRQQSEGQLQTARGTYQQVIGYYPPGDLVEPQPLALPVKTQQDATALACTQQSAGRHGPVQRRCRERRRGCRIRAAAAAGQHPGPDVRAEPGLGARLARSSGYQIVAALSVPIYQGGSEYSAVRQAKQQAQQTQQAGGRRASHRRADRRAVLGDARRRQGRRRQPARADPRQPDRPGGRGA